jgi:hypothetical protein
MSAMPCLLGVPESCSKIGGWLREQALTLSLHLASSHPGEPLWHLLAARLNLRE